MVGTGVEFVVVVEEEGWAREKRRVSGRPGAEGAEGWAEEWVVRFVVVVGCGVEGMWRRDWSEGEG